MTVAPIEKMVMTGWFYVSLQQTVRYVKTLVDVITGDSMETPEWFRNHRQGGLRRAMVQVNLPKGTTGIHLNDSRTIAST